MSELYSYKKDHLRIKKAFAGILTVMAAAWNTDIAADQVLQNSKDTKVESLYEYTTSSKNNLVITTVGYGDPNYDDLAITVGRSLNPSNVAEVDYGSEVDVNSIYNQTLELIREKGYQEVSLYGVSFGGMVSIELAAKLLRSGIKVSTIYLDSTPSSLANTTDKSKAGATMVEVIPFGIIARSVGEFSIKIAERHDGTLWEKWQYSWEKSSNMPNSLLKSQSKYLRKGISLEDIQTLNNHGVQVVYIRTANDKDDTMVKVSSSVFDFEAWFIDINVLVGDGIGHAGTTHHEDKISEMLAAYNKYMEQRANFLAQNQPLPKVSNDK